MFDIVKSYENRRKISILTQTVSYFRFSFSPNSKIIILIYNSRKFSSSKKLCKAGLEIGFYISASGIITFKSGESLRKIFANVPNDRLLIETDSPFLAPVPHRGKRNEPAYVVNTAQVLADLKGLEISELADITTNNFLKLFNRVKANG